MTRYCYDYARPAVTADCVLFLRDGDRVKLLLVQRKDDPYKGKWAVPGGFINIDETTEQAAIRELHEETGLTAPPLTRVDVFDAVDRDPRGRSITVAYTGFVAADQAAQARSGDDAAALHWFDLDRLPDLAFDHDRVLARAREIQGV